MGLQDRDYYREKNENPSQSRGRAQHNQRKNKGARYLIYPAIVLVLIGCGAEFLLNHRATGFPIAWPSFIAKHLPAKATREQRSITANNANTDEIILKADGEGHFRGTATINGIPMPFIIDTGATKTTIPLHMAQRAGLPFGQFIQTNTAGGKVTERLTRIESLRIGNTEIRDLEASINQHLNEVLIGMSTLKNFRTIQNGSTLKMVLNGLSPEPADKTSNDAATTFSPSNNSIGSIKPPTQEARITQQTNIKKTVSCDTNQVCKTRYSDH